MAMMRRLSVALLCVMICSMLTSAQQRDINKLKQEREATKREIKETSQKITTNERETQRNLSRLNSLRAEITEKNVEIGAIQLDVDSIDMRVKAMADSISGLEAQRAKLRNAYAASLRKTQPSLSSVNLMSFVFSSESFGQAYQRMRYIKEFSNWRKRKTAEISEITDRLALRKQSYDSLQQQRLAVLSQLSNARNRLQATHNETNQLVAKLKKEGGALRKLLKQKEQRARALDREVDRLIAAEQQKSSASGSKKSSGKKAGTGVAGTAADRALTGSFESNKGRLLFPVSGSYRIVRPFGRHKHPDLEHVETENSGIDIEVGPGSMARAIFKGKVSAIFQQPGFNTIVMIRHGNYLSIYANLASINVKMGDVVNTGQSIGTIFADPDEGNSAILHFELRKERTKLNPTLWVK